MLDRMKDLGFKISTKAGMTVGIADILTLEEKHEILEKAHDTVEKITKSFRRGLITDDEDTNALSLYGMLPKMKSKEN